MNCKEYHRNYYQRNKERLDALNHQYADEHREATRAYHTLYQKEWRKRNKDKVRGYEEKTRERRKALKLPLSRGNPESKRRYVTENKKKIAEYKKVWAFKNKHRRKPEINGALRCKKFREIHKNDISYRVAGALRSRLRVALKGNLKSCSAVRDLGCSIDEFKLFVSNKFSEGMTWDNWGSSSKPDTWQLDHIVPISRFNLADPEQQRQAFHYTNYQPLWSKDNAKKFNRTPDEYSALIKSMEIK